MDDLQVKLVSGDVTTISRKLDGGYPAVTQLLPTDYAITATVKGSELKSALSRIAVFTDPKNLTVTLNFDDKLVISSEAQDIGGGVETISCELNGEAIEVRANLKYLMLGINSLDGDNLKFQINTPKTPVTVVANDNSIFLFMPVCLTGQ
jgi:DNA polymerase-3 subunit beta